MKKPGLLAAAALLVLSVWEVAVLLRARAAAPVDADWQAVRAVVDAGFQKGDLIVFAPAWMDPVGRKFLGAHLTVDDVARMDDARYGRVWEVSARGAAAPEARGPVTRDERHGALRLRLVERAPARVLWDLRPRAQLLEVDFVGRRCVPLDTPGTLDAGSVPLGKTLAVRAGLSDFRSRRDNRAFARLTVLIDGAVVGETTIGSDSGWAAVPDIATAPGPAKLSFSSELDPSHGGPPARLSLCLAAEARQ